MRFEGTHRYIATNDLRMAVNAAVTLERTRLAFMARREGR